MPNDNSNAIVARALTQLADYLELAGENPYKSRAYRNAVTTLMGMRESVASVAADGRLADLPGFGNAIQAKTKDILATGTTASLEKMRKLIPEGALKFLQLPGLGPKSVAELYAGLGVDSVAALEAAALDGRIQGISGMGPKMAEKVLDSIARYRRYAGHILASTALVIADDLVDQLRGIPGVVRAEYAGSIRRGAETARDINLVASTMLPDEVLDAFVSLPLVDSVVSSTQSSARVVLSGGTSADLYVSTPAMFGALFQFRTGSQAHNTKIAAIAQLRGFALTNGSVTLGGESVDSVSSEIDLYRLLGLPDIPPCLREDRGEVEAAIAGTLPRSLEIGDIRGNLHTHTTYSDGKLTLHEMASAAREIGYEYLAITDHTHSLAIANGLSPERVREQIKAVREAQETVGIRLLAGTECDIKADGTMDLPDELLKDLDFVIASVHSRFKMTEAEMTERILAAVRNPNVDMVAHPTGRLINSREPYPLNMERLIASCLESDTALEINASPERLDLNELDAKSAKDAGVKIFINSDAHSRSDLDLMKYGVSIARRAWLTASDVWNTRSYTQLQSWLERDR